MYGALLTLAFDAAALARGPLAEALALLVVTLHVLGMVAAVHALLTARSSQACIAWSISLLTFPYVALPLYLLIGSNKFEGYERAFRAGRLEHGGPSTGFARGVLERFPAPRAREHGPAAEVFERLARVPFTGGNRALLLVDGRATYDAMFDAIRDATRYVLVEFFTVNDDGVGRELKDRLVERARMGVYVAFVYDQFGSWWLQRPYLDELRDAGVEVVAFTTDHVWGARQQVNFRNHRKIVVVDGRVAMVGGFNVGDEHLGLSPRYGPWRDTNVMVEGPAVLGVQLVFLEDYHWASGGRFLDVSWSPHPTDGNVDALYLPYGPAEPVETGILFFLHMINAAQRRLWLASPYFVPDESVLDALKLADLRGVEVRILLPRRYDHVVMHMAALSYLPELETQTGIELYLYPGYTHQKVLLVDDWLSAVGSGNLDNRSMRLNFEGHMVLASRSLAASVESMLAADFARSERIGAAQLHRMGSLMRLGARICRLFDPIL